MFAERPDGINLEDAHKPEKNLEGEGKRSAQMLAYQEKQRDIREKENEIAVLDSLAAEKILKDRPNESDSNVRYEKIA